MWQLLITRNNHPISFSALSGLLAASLLFLFPACDHAPVKEQRAPTKILFLGTSLLGENNLPRVFEQIAASRGDRVDVLGHVPGLSSSLAKQALGDPVFLQEELPSKAWDFAVIQEHSELPIQQDL